MSPTRFLIAFLLLTVAFYLSSPTCMVVRQFCYDYSGMYVNQMETYSLLLAMHTERENLLYDIAGSELVVSQLRALLKLKQRVGK